MLVLSTTVVITIPQTTQESRIPYGNDATIPGTITHTPSLVILYRIPCYVHFTVLLHISRLLLPFHFALLVLIL